MARSGKDLSGPVRRTDLQWLAPIGEARHLEPGVTLFEEGSVPDAVYVVDRGTVTLSRTRRGGKIHLILLRDGAILGDVFLLTGSPATCDAVAMTPTDCLRLPAPTFVKALREVPSFAAHWALWGAKRTAALRGRLGVVLAGDLQSQVASLLLTQAAHAEPVELTQQAIADLLGVPRTSISRVLKELSHQGVVKVGYRHVAIVDHASLASAATGFGTHRPDHRLLKPNTTS